MLRLTLIFLCLSHVVFGQLIFDETEVSVTVSPGQEEISAVFPFKIGEKDIEVLKHEAHCTCLDAHFTPLLSDRSSRKVWKAGETGTVVGKFSVGNFQGVVKKNITLYLKGEKDPVTLIVAVTIPKLVSIEPSTHRWPLLGEKEPKVFQITVDQKSSIQIKKVKSNSDDFDYELVTVEPGRKYELKVTPNDLSSPRAATFSLRTDSKVRQFKRLKCFAVINTTAP